MIHISISRKQAKTVHGDNQNIHRQMASVASYHFPNQLKHGQLSKNRDLANFLRGFQIVITFSFTSFAPWTNNELECSHAENLEDVLKCGGETGRLRL